MKLFKRSRNPRLWENIAFGIAGGLTGAWLMNQSQAVMTRIAGPSGSGPRNGPQTDPATVVVAEKLSESVTGHPLAENQKKIADPIVHYGVGAVLGAVYGALISRTPLVKMGIGTLYGTAVWLLADEIAVPLLKLSGPPRQYPASQHLQALGAHLVYGLAAESVRRAGLKLVA